MDIFHLSPLGCSLCISTATRTRFSSTATFAAIHTFPLIAALIIAHAQQTPLCTSIAWTGQFMAHAPHSIHEDGCISSTCSFPSAKTPWGQTCVQRRQLMHLSG